MAQRRNFVSEGYRGNCIALLEYMTWGREFMNERSDATTPEKVPVRLSHGQEPTDNAEDD